MLTILCVKDYSRTEDNYLLLAEHIPADLLRRCEHQYKKPSHQVQILNLDRKSQQQDENTEYYEPITNMVIQHLEVTDNDVIIIGKDVSKYEEDEFSILVQTLPDLAPTKTIIIAKSCAKMIPFSLVTSSRRFLICMKSSEDPYMMITKSLNLLRPTDSVCVLCIHESRSPKGNSRETRFALGERNNWVKGMEEKLPQYHSPGWNDSDLEELRTHLYELLSLAQVPGDVRIEEEKRYLSIGQEICRVGIEEQADFLVLRRGIEREVTLECIENSQSSIVILE